ncbi:MAG: PASTA domain-containing protein [Clostridiales bacterium]|nr:PASTA domain-containing protein [Clostridiales bacterium]
MAIVIAISFIFSALIIRLFIIQIINGSSLQAKATDQWTRDLKIIAQRGKVVDRTGSALAVSYTTYNVYVRSREVQNTSVVANILSSELSLSFEKIYTKIKNNNASEVLIKMQVEGEVVEKIYNHNLKGVYFAETANRYYPYGNLLSQVLGFISIDNVGQSGIEAYYDNYLKGVDGFSYVQSDLQGKEIGGSLRYYYPSQSGEDLLLTIDSKMQIILESSLEKIMVEQKSKSATGIILDVVSGGILALSSKPSFDLNEIPRDDLSLLFEQSKVKAITDIYEPGSTFKILTVAAALEEGLTSENDRFYCPGYRIVDGIKIKCWRTIGHGSQTLIEAFANSCNCCFMDLALRLGVDKFYEYAARFGLGQKTGVDMSGEASGILMNKSQVKNVDLARMGFGHAIALTPMQLVSAVSSIVNGGYYNSPHLIDLNNNENINKKFLHKEGVISQITTQMVNKLLEFAENKTGKWTFVEGYNVGGKTGTAQKYKEGGGIDQGKYISSFIGTYPADNPRYIVFVMVDEPSAGAYYGSIVAAPYGKEIFSGMFDYLAEKKQSEQVMIEYVEMPDLQGKSLSESIILLKSQDFEYEIDGEGEYVLKQLPPAGTTLQKGDTVLLIT